MPFPNSPANGQLATVNNLVYVYNSTKGVWNKANVSAPLQTQTISITGNITTSANLSIAGQASITGNITTLANLRVTGQASITDNVRIQSSTLSTSTTSGALIVAGGIGVSGSVYANQVYDNGARVATTGKAIAMSIVFGG
jgi:hypothetical protein